MKLFAKGPAIVLGVLALAAEPVDLATNYVEGATIRTEAESTSEVEVTELTATLGGEELPREALAGLEKSLNERTTNSTTFLDSFLDVDEGRPTRLRRTFESVQRFEEKGDRENDETGVFEGLTLELTVDDDGEVTAQVVGDGDEAEEAGDLAEAYMENHRMIFLADYLLPDEPVEVGDSWTIDEDGAKRVAGLGPSPHVFRSDERRTGGMDEVIDRAGEVSMEATFAGIEDHDDLRCAHLTFETQIAASLDELPESFTRGKEPGEVSGALELELTIEGEAWFALDQRRPVEIVEDMSGALVIDMNMQVGPEGQKREIEIRIEASLGGTNHQNWSREE